MLGLAVLIAAAAQVPAAPAPAAPVVASPAAEHVSLTVYRDPARGKRQPMDLRWLGGFALITETRTIHVPAGAATLRFEGVADGIIPASAIVTGLPGGVIEKNRDAHLLSPAALIDGTLGRNVTLRRTDRKTGKVSIEDATIVAGAETGVVLKTPAGIETLRCSGLPEGLVFHAIPAGLSAKPVLSVETRSAAAADVRVTLSYLASGFDWSASYVATVAPGGRTLDLFAWLTLANGNAQGWQDVALQAVAGRLSRQSDREIVAAAARLELHCFPLGTTTSDLPTIEPYRRMEKASDEIVVTAMRLAPPITAMPAPPAPPPPPPPPPEDLGDLKLYRVPERVDVSPNGEKQVALLAAHRVRAEKTYRVHLYPWQVVEGRPATIALRIRNVTDDGLGIPLPAGTTGLYQPRGTTRLLLGTGTIGDTAKSETTRLTAGISPQILVSQRLDARRRHVTLDNAQPVSVTVEVAIGGAGDRPFADPTAPLPRIDGVQTWRVTVPANGSATLDYALPTS